MIRLALVYFFSLGTCFHGVAQSKDLILHGVVRDSDSKAPIPFASISITNTTRGTAANEFGKFTLVVKHSEHQNHLKISSIGHLTKVYKISSLDTGNLKLELQSDVTLLSEVTITENAIKPVDVVRQAIDSLTINYASKPFNMEYYSTLVATNDLTAQKFKIESLLFGYSSGYGNTAPKKFKIVKKRTEGDNPLKASDYPFWPSLEIHRADVISDPMKTGILNIENIDKFVFAYSGVSVYDTDTVYQIDYHAPKPTKKITGYAVPLTVYKGSIYVTIANNAIVRHDIHTDQFQHSIIYKKIGRYYFPYLITGQRSLKSPNVFTKVQNSLILTNVVLDEVQAIDGATNEFQNITELPEDPAYWESNYPNIKE